MMGVIIIDLLLTLHGQPKTYWHDPSTALEPNPGVRHVMVLGWAPFLLITALYCAAAFALASFLPVRVSFVASLVYTLVHFYAGSTWLEWRMGLGMNSVFLYGISLAIAIALCLRSDPKEPDQSLLAPTAVGPPARQETREP
jgi:hypothetical protein